ncbi:aldo/keto reductase [Streptomyces sp. NPDC048254]|uniref:aldo/keto reductase n=1 Tax=Streptomyces sp. NPDC048254 TaxID=3365525 RepID=UPI00371BBBEE
MYVTGMTAQDTEERERWLRCAARGHLAGNRNRTGEQHTLRAASDALADSRFRAYADADFDVIDTLGAISREHGRPPAQIALAWLLTRPAVSAPIIGATKPRHIDDAIAALEVTLSEQDLHQLYAPYRSHPVLGHS